MVLFISGNALVVGISLTPERTTWLAILLASLFYLPVMLIYCRLLSLFPGRHLYEIITLVFGGILGKVISVLYILFSAFLCDTVMRCFAEFLQIAAMPATPEIVFLIFMFFLSVWMVKSGVDKFGQWCSIMTVIVLIAIGLTAVLGVKYMHLENMFPIGTIHYPGLFKEAFSIFCIPYAESILFMSLFKEIKPSVSPYKIFSLSLVIAMGIFVVIAFRNTMLLGVNNLKMSYYPSFYAVSIISLGDFFSRFEVLIGMIFLICNYVKITVALFSTSIGFAHLTKVDQPAKVVTPIALLVVSTSTILFSSNVEINGWLPNYEKLFVVFSVALPLIMLITAEMQVRIRRLLRVRNG